MILILEIVAMEQSRGTYTSIGIAASTSSDKIKLSPGSHAACSSAHSVKL